MSRFLIISLLIILAPTSLQIFRKIIITAATHHGPHTPPIFYYKAIPIDDSSFTHKINPFLQPVTTSREDQSFSNGLWNQNPLSPGHPTPHRRRNNWELSRQLPFANNWKQQQQHIEERDQYPNQPNWINWPSITKPTSKSFRHIGVGMVQPNPYMSVQASNTPLPFYQIPYEHSNNLNGKLSNPFLRNHHQNMFPGLYEPKEHKYDIQNSPNEYTGRPFQQQAPNWFNKSKESRKLEENQYTVSPELIASIFNITPYSMQSATSIQNLTTSHPTVPSELISTIFNTTPVSNGTIISQSEVESPESTEILNTPQPTVSPELIANIFNKTPYINTTIISQRKESPPTLQILNTPRPTVSSELITIKPALSADQKLHTSVTHEKIQILSNSDFIFPDSPNYIRREEVKPLYDFDIDPRRKR